MKIKTVGILITVLLLAGAAYLYVKDSGNDYRISQLDITEEKNPPSYAGKKANKAVTISMNVTYRGGSKNLNFRSTCQNADLALKHSDGREVPVIVTRMCGDALSNRQLKSGDTIEAKEMFDLSGFEPGTYTLMFSYQDALSFEKKVTIK